MHSLRNLTLCAPILVLLLATTIYAADGEKSMKILNCDGEHPQKWLMGPVNCECECSERETVGRYGFVCPPPTHTMLREAVVKRGHGEAQKRSWGQGGLGWDVRVELRTWPHAPSVSPLDWSERWNKTKECLSDSELDNVNNFEIDEVAMNFFWERVWACFLEYVMVDGDGGGDGLPTTSPSPIHNEHGNGSVVLNPRQVSQGDSRIVTFFHATRMIMMALAAWLGDVMVEMFVWLVMQFLDLVEAILALVWRSLVL